MTSRDVIENKISSMRKFLGLLDRYQGYSKAKIQEDIDLKGAIERYLYLAAQSAIDLAEALIAFKNLRKPATMAESFRNSSGRRTARGRTGWEARKNGWIPEHPCARV